MGRTVVHGELYVDGRPLAETATAADSLNPSPAGTIPQLLAGACRAPLSAAGSPGRLSALLRECAPGAVIVCDGSSEDDLRETAVALAEAGRPVIAAGTGGFVGHWADRLPVARRYAPLELTAGRTLVVSGSLHPASRGQVRRAAQAGLRAVYLGRQPDSETVSALIDEDWAVLATPGDLPAAVSSRMGALVGEALARQPVDCLVVFGGDTALAVMSALGVTTVESAGELLPGMPVSIAAYAGRRLVLVTKAGGFGGDDALLAIKQNLERAR